MSQLKATVILVSAIIIIIILAYIISRFNFDMGLPPVQGP